MSHPLSRDLKGAYTVWYRDVLRFFTDRARIIGSLGQPILFLFVFGGGLASAMSGLAGGAVDFKQFMFPGILAMSVFMTSMMSAMSIVWDREFGFLKEVLVAPVSRTAVALGKIAGGATVAVFQGVIVLLLAPLIDVSLTFGQVALLVALMFLMAATMASLGLMLASRQKSTEGFGVIMQFLMMPLLFTSGAFFPLQDVPGWLEVIARVNPVTYGVDALRQVALSESLPAAAIDQLSLHGPGMDAIIMAAIFLVFLGPAVLLFGKQD